MVEAAIPSEQAATRGRSVGHAGWVRICHWTIVLAFSVLAFSGYFILMTHPRLYWGEVGNDLTPALLEFPISDNHRPDKWVETTRFGDSETPLVSANRTYEIYNQNSWGRSLHFLAAWVFVAGLMVYVAAALATGHAWRNLISGLTNVLSARLLDDLKQHLRRDRAHATGPPYGLVQRLSYVMVIFTLLPLMVITGLTMSPAVTAAYPVLLDVFGGYQSARTVHFFGFALLILFFIVHLVMVVRAGFRRQMKAMIAGGVR